MDCLFCAIANWEQPADHVHQDEETVSFLDNHPLFPGHCLVVPRRHVATLPELPPDLVAPLFAHAQALARAMEEALGAQGSFVAINNKVSQSVPHLHVHVVPRRRQDGLKGFFWPRHDYASASEREAVRAKLADQMLRSR